MSERDVFLGALDQRDVTARSAYLDRVCAGKPWLRQRIEHLLHSYERLDKFLEEPAVEQLSRDDHLLACLIPSDEPGSLGRLDRYEILEVHGRGSTGIVFRARDSKLQRIVAIKVLAPRLASSKAARKRFVREAQAAAAIRDDHVIGIHEVNDEGPLPYLVMDYIAGMTLDDRIHQGEQPELKEILRIALQTASGLAAAHAQGLVHRDIKPANILLENGVQRVKITDFGLALTETEAGVADRKQLAGTPLYMSPEQSRGEPTDHRTDMFSLGSLLYTLCTGRPPFEADSTVELLRRVCEDIPQAIRELNPAIPEWLCEIIARLHAKKAVERIASARELTDVLSRRLAALQLPHGSEWATLPVALPAQQAQPRTLSKPWWRRLFAGSALGVLIVLIFLTVVWRPWRRTEPNAGSTASGDQETPVVAVKLDLNREAIPPHLLALAGGGNPARAPAELAAVLGDGRYLLPRVGQAAWPQQSPDGRLLAVPLDEDVILFRCADGAYWRTLKGAGGRIFRTVFSPDSRLLAATSRLDGAGGFVRVWDVPAERVVFTKPQSGPTVSCAATFSPDGRCLVTECGDGAIAVWDARSGAQLQSLTVFPGGIGSLNFDPGGNQLAVSGFRASKIALLQWAQTRFTRRPTELSHRQLVAAAVFSPDGKWLATGDQIELKLWDARTLQEAGTIATEAQELTFAPDSQSIFAAATNNLSKSGHTFTRWSTVTRRNLAVLPVPVATMPVCAFHCMNRDCSLLFVLPQWGATYVQVVGIQTGQEKYPRQGHRAPLNVVAVSPDGKTAASTGEDWVIKVWDLPSGQVRHTLAAHMGTIFGLAFRPDGKRLASGSQDGTIAIWDVDRGTELRALHGHSRQSSQIAWSPDGRTLAAGGEFGMVKVWDATTGQEVAPLTGHTSAVRCVAYDASGTLLASGGADTTVRIHHLGQGDSQTFSLPAPVGAVAVSADGRTLAAAEDGPGGDVHVWDLAAGAETKFQCHAGPVYGVAFSPSAPLLATSGGDGTVRLWDLDDGRKPVRTIGPGPFGGPVRALAFTPDGRYLCTANANGMVYILRI
jgi:WD40 repeat protein/tRNA A-37 threonylcarbamoyl transferase component Bud32